MKWWEAVNAYGVSAVAENLGLERGRGGRSTWSPCPSCGAQQRGRNDRRGPIGARTDDQGWTCHRCDAGGGVLDLAAWVLQGANYSDLNDDPKRTVRGWFADQGWCDPPPGERAALPRREPPKPRPPEPPKRPPTAEVAELADACGPVNEDAEVSTWIKSRGLNPDPVAELDLARALPATLEAPPWAALGATEDGKLWKPWTTGWRLIVSLWGPGGRLESLHARYVGGTLPEGGRKGISPRGFEVRGLVMANAQGRRMLAGEAPERGLVIVEGVPDFLTAATRYEACAVVGVISGSWVAEVAVCVPDGTRVAVRTHDDPGGDEYAERVRKTLAGRCKVTRNRLTEIRRYA